MQTGSATYTGRHRSDEQPSANTSPYIGRHRLEALTASIAPVVELPSPGILPDPAPVSA